MTGDDWVRIIQAIGAVILAALAVLVPVILSKVNGVHKIVNSNNTALVTRVDQLVEAMHAGGVTVPAVERPVNPATDTSPPAG
jgi:glycosyltransferase involved in cell wall biosynthesis